MGVPHVLSIVSVIVFSVINISSYVVRFTELMGLAQGIVSMIVYYFLVLQTLVCFARVVSTSPGRPKDLAEKGLPSMQSGQTKSGKTMRMCNKCQCYKPDRCHHCSDCQACTLKMDHHCPWVNNCVGFHNYKFFVLFLVNGSISCGYTIGLLLYAVLQRPYSEFAPWDISSLVNIVAVGIFGLGAFGLMCYHMSLMFANQTTIEQLKSGNPDEYSLGLTENIRQVLGATVLVWCVPCVWGVSPSYDGVEWGRPEPGAPSGTEMLAVGPFAGGADTSSDQQQQPGPSGGGNGVNGGGGNGVHGLTGSQPTEARHAAVGDIAVVVEGGGGGVNGAAMGQLVKRGPFSNAAEPAPAPARLGHGML